jgi:hypothetical protein
MIVLFRASLSGVGICNFKVFTVGSGFVEIFIMRPHSFTYRLRGFLFGFYGCCLNGTFQALVTGTPTQIPS